MRVRGEVEERPPLRAAVVVIPARDEEQEIGGALEAVVAAVEAAGLPVVVVTVLDRCTDGTATEAARVAAQHPHLDLRAVTSTAGTLGGARAQGAAAGLAALRGVPPDAVWLGSTDADSRVQPGWLAVQRELADTGLDLVLGTVEPLDDGGHPQSARLWSAQHHLAEGHTAIHAANLGVRASAYLEAGGFPQTDVNEDAALVHAVRETCGLPWTSTDRTRVGTSARRDGRVDGGFARFLRRLDDVVQAHGVSERLESALRDQILRLVDERGPGRTICPSEAAGAVDPDRRRALTHLSRAVACQLADEGAVVVTQGGVVVDGRTTPGPVRIGRPATPGG